MHGALAPEPFGNDTAHHLPPLLRVNNVSLYHVYRTSQHPAHASDAGGNASCSSRYLDIRQHHHVPPFMPRTAVSRFTRATSPIGGTPDLARSSSHTASHFENTSTPASTLLCGGPSRGRMGTGGGHLALLHAGIRNNMPHQAAPGGRLPQQRQQQHAAPQGQHEGEGIQRRCQRLCAREVRLRQGRLLLPVPGTSPAVSGRSPGSPTDCCSHSTSLGCLRSLSWPGMARRARVKLAGNERCGTPPQNDRKRVSVRCKQGRI